MLHFTASQTLPSQQLTKNIASTQTIPTESMISKHYLLEKFEKNKPLTSFDSGRISLLMSSSFRTSVKEVPNLMWIIFSSNKFIPATSPTGLECRFCIEENIHQPVLKVPMRRKHMESLPPAINSWSSDQPYFLFCTITYKFRNL